MVLLTKSFILHNRESGMAECRNGTKFMCENPDCFHLSFLSFKRYLNHVRNRHSYEPNFKIVCPSEGCFRSYKVLSSLTSHIARKHNTELEESEDYLPVDIDLNVGATQPDDGNPDDELRLDYNENEAERTDDIPVKLLALYALKTQELNRLTDSTTNQIIQSTSQLFEQNDSYVKQGVKQCLQNSGIDVKDVDGLEDLLKSSPKIVEPVQKLKSSQERRKYFIDNFQMVVS